MIQTAEIDRRQLGPLARPAGSGARTAIIATLALHALVAAALAVITLQLRSVPRTAPTELQLDLSSRPRPSRAPSEIVAPLPVMPPACPATPFQILELPRAPLTLTLPPAPPAEEFPTELDSPPNLLPTEELAPPVKDSVPRAVAKPNDPQTEQGSVRGQAKPKPAEFVQASVRSRAKLNYPDSARRRGQQGTTHIRVDISRSGIVTDATVSRSSGVATLDLAALKAASKWKFHPARRGATPTSSQLVIPISFRLD